MSAPKHKGCLGYEVPKEVMAAIIGTTIDFDLVRDVDLKFPLNGEATVGLTMILRKDQIDQLKKMIIEYKAPEDAGTFKG